MNFLDKIGLSYLWDKIANKIERHAQAIASTNTLGHVKIGNGIAVSTDGTISTDNSKTPSHTHAASDIKSGTLAVNRGGTGASSFASNYPLFGNGAGALQAKAPVDAMALLGDGYGTCATAAATTAKVVSLASFKRRTGSRVTVYFTYAVPANATMNVNSTGAAAMRYKGAAITAGLIPAGACADFVFDGTYWQLVGTSNAPINIVTGSYTGAGGTSRTFAFGFKPKLLFVNGLSTGSAVVNSFIVCDGSYSFSFLGHLSTHNEFSVSVSSTGVTVSGDSYAGLLDSSSYTYNYVAIG